MKFFIKTFGCRANQAESGEISRVLVLNGFTYTDNLLDVDFVILNTCTVTHRADKDVRKFISHVKKINPDAKILATGCYVERDEKIFLEKGVRHVFKNDNKGEILKYLINKDENIFPCDSSFFNVRPFLKIEDGCNFRCSYCIIPHVRGKVKSADIKSILEKIEILSKNHREIVLTGINLGSYGKDIGITLYDLLSEIYMKKIDIKIRLSSLEPMEFDYRILEFIEKGLLQPHFHIPLQSGSDKILKLMNRPYKRSDFLKIVEEINKFSKYISIGTDVICGFPGESRGDFLDTFYFLKKLPFSYFHIFSYSPREGTKVYDLKNRVDPKEIKIRSKILHRLDCLKRKRFKKMCRGKSFWGVVLEREGDIVKILTENYISITKNDKNLNKGDVTIVKI